MKLLVVAGEASADKRVASVLSDLKSKLGKRKQKLYLYGVGGGSLINLGMDITCHLSQTAVMGFTEVLHKIPFFSKLLDDLVNKAVAEKVDAAVLVDMPDFNLRLAKKLKQKNIKIIYYISPQVWAWRTSRVEIIKKYVDKMMVIFPFEEAFYKSHNVNVSFVGHPALEELRPLAVIPKRDFLKVGILPGSRKQEINKLLPIYIDAIFKLIEKYPNQKIAPTILLAKHLSLDDLYKAVGKNVLDKLPNLTIDESGDISKMSDCDFAIVASGTATLEMGVLGIPMVVAYKVSLISSLIYKYFVKYKGFISMINIIHKKEVVKELIQEKASSNEIANELSCFMDSEYRKKVRNNLLDTRKLLDVNSLNAAEVMLNVLNV